MIGCEYLQNLSTLHGCGCVLGTLSLGTTHLVELAEVRCTAALQNVDYSAYNYI